MSLESGEKATIVGNKETLLCGNCNKKIHCVAGQKENDDKVVMVKDRCNKDACECRCRTHFIGKNGRLRKYGTVDNSTAIEEPVVEYNDETEKLIQQINASYHRNERKQAKRETFADICDELEIPYIPE